MKMRHVLAVAALAASAVSASAAVVDLTSPLSSGVINGALFETTDFRTSGTGVINPFVRISGNSEVVQGYNTSGRPLPFNENNSPNFTRDLTYGEIPTLTIQGVDYKEFLLDINQFSSQPFLSLDKVEIYTSTTPGQNTTAVSTLGTLRYEMDAGSDSHVKLNYLLATGSGQGDMRMLVPVSMFGGVSDGTFIYLYSLFGQNFANNDGFEEWAVNDADGVPVVPLPAAAWSGLATLAGVGIIVRRRAAR